MRDDGAPGRSFAALGVVYIYMNVATDFLGDNEFRSVCGVTQLPSSAASGSGTLRYAW
jgi:hypothetical protein